MVMKRKVLLTILLVACFQIVKAQTEFAPIGATWYYSGLETMFGDEGYSKVTSVGDTIIDGKKIRVLSNEYHSSTGSVSYGDDFYVCQSGDSVLYYIDGDFRLVYDFGLNVGDTLQIYSNKNYCGDSNYGYVIIDSISYVDVNGVKLKEFYPSKTEESEFGFEGTFIENIGATSGLFSSHCLADNIGEALGSLRCYEDSTIGLYHYHYSNDCEYTFQFDYEAYLEWEKEEAERWAKEHGIDNIIDETVVKSISYSRSDRTFTIAMSDECEIYEMQIFDMRGVCVWSDVYESNVMNFTVPKSGVYVLKINMGGQNYVEKIVAY